MLLSLNDAFKLRTLLARAVATRGGVRRETPNQLYVGDQPPIPARRRAESNRQARLQGPAGNSFRNTWHVLRTTMA